MVMKRAYIYPITARDNTNLHNPYIEDFMQSLSSKIEFVNCKTPSDSGILDVFRYLRKLNVVFFNWIENLPDKKYGGVQAVVLFLLVPMLKMFGITVIWTMHNKISNAKSNIQKKQRIFKFMLNQANLVLTHSSEGIQYALKIQPGYDKSKILFAHHPIKNRLKYIEAYEKDIDILIWGSIYPYKGVDTFLRLLHDKSIEGRYSITIAGKIMNNDLRQTLLQLKTPSIDIRDYYLPEEELCALIYRARIVLFTYTSEGVLSSGALIDSLSFGANILGPDKAAFHDLMNENVINTYTDWEDMLTKIESMLHSTQERDIQKVKTFISNNSWMLFGQNLLEKLNLIT